MKVFLISINLIMLLVMTGCDNKKSQVLCTKSTTTDGVTTVAKVIGELDGNNKITSLDVTYTVSNDDTAKSYCSLFKLLEEERNITVSCSDRAVNIKGLESVGSQSDGEKSLIGKTKNDFVNSLKKDEFSCK